MAQRVSSLHEQFPADQTLWREIAGMQAAVALSADARPSSITLADASCLPRMGVKGARAESWLVSQGVQPSAGANTWTRTADGTLVARLARSEFFLEGRADGGSIARLRAALKPASGVTPVLRQDAALVLFGPRVNELLVQVCNIDFRAHATDARDLVMTSMVGVSVLVLWEPFKGLPRYRIWCDHSFAPYLWETLMQIAQEMEGGAAGLQQLLPEEIGGTT